MFTNVILLSLLTIIYGINGEDGNRGLREQNAFSFLDAPTQHEDLNFFKTPRAIRTPFRNTEIMTARGFGKRNGGGGEQDDNGIDNLLNRKLALPSIVRPGPLSTARGFGKRDENTATSMLRGIGPGQLSTARGFGKRDDNVINRQSDESEDKVQRTPYFFPYFQEMLKLPRVPESNGIAAPIRNHRLQLRDGPLRFRLNDGNLRIGRGFGKRSFFIDTPAEESNSYDSADVLKALAQLKGNKEEAK